MGAHAQLGTEPPGRAGRERRASPALAGSRGRYTRRQRARSFRCPRSPWRLPRSGAHPGEVRIQRAWPRSEPVLGCRMRPAAAPCFLCCIFFPPEFGLVCVSAGFSPALASRAVTVQMVAERLSTPWRGNRQRGGAGGGVKLPLGKGGGMDEGCFLRYSPESYSR